MKCPKCGSEHFYENAMSAGRAWKYVCIACSKAWGSFEEHANTQVDGIWVVYMWDECGPHPKTIHFSVNEAVRAHGGGYEISYWPYGVELREAIEKWKAGEYDL